MSFYENITVSAAVPNAAADAEAAKDAAVVAKNEAEAAKDAAEAAKNLAEQHKDTASGYVSSVSNAQSIADANVTATSADKTAAEAARDLAYSYGQAASLSAQSAQNSANQVSANAATVADMADNINIVAGLQNTLVTVANDLGISGNIPAVRPYVNQIDTVAGMVANVATVAADAADIGTVATDLTGSNNIGTVAGLETKINTVAGLSAELTSVHGNNADISTVATNLNAGNNIANVSSNIDNVNTVANAISDVLLVKNALSDIAAVENKLTEIDNVSDSITAVETVAGDVYKANVETVASISDDVTNLSKSTGNMATLVSKLGQTTDLAGAVTDAQNSATSAASSASTASTHATTASGHATTAATHAANLGSVAYQDLTAIAESKAVTAKDVFVYDTSKDSDGGAWRNRTQGTSWYNEPLNTSTRGATKKFPAVAVIVAESNKVVIYDADDPTMPMWMEFQAQRSGITGSTDRFSVAMLDGLLTIGYQKGLGYYNFVTEHIERIHSVNSPNTGVMPFNIAQRNINGTGVGGSLTYQIVDPIVNDVAVTVLPNAPIDPDTGLPVPTIAVATDGGVSVIKDDGSVVDITGQVSYVKIVAWKGNKLVTNGVYGDAIAIYEIPSADQGHSPREAYYVWQSHSAFFKGSTFDAKAIKDDETIVVGCAKGLQQIHHTDGDDQASLINKTTSSYNTGWMNGDTKLATLMDTTAETISAPELVTNGDFSSFGSELVDNGDFSTTSDWTFPNGDGSISNGQATVTATTDSNKYIRQDLGNSLVSGKTYAVSFNVVAETGTGLAYVRLGGVDVAPVGSYPQGVETHYITYTGGSPELRFMTYANSGAGFTIDDVSVKEVTGWTALTNASISINAGKLRLTSNGATDGYVASDYFSTTVGKTYRLSLDFVNETGSYEKVYVQNANGGTIADSVDGLGTDQTVTLTFVATTSTSRVRLKTYNGTSGWDNFSCVQVEPDRSVNNNGLNINGNIVKSAVATGAELMGYGTTGASNYLTEPYNPDYNFGYGDFCIMGWAKHVGGDQTLFYRGTGNGFQETGGLYLWINNHKLKLRAGGNRQFEIDAPISPMTSGQWHHYVVCRRNGTVYAYQDGVLFHSQDISVSNIDSSTHITKISSGYYANNNVSNRLALLRISATAPTSEQIAKIYRDEKPLFQEGAKCTLHGNSDDINGLSYDDDTGITHAGTANSNGTGGLSEFTGLQRTGLNSNTISVGAAVSAQNGLVVSE
jgi:hypothetical protein